MEQKKIASKLPYLCARLAKKADRWDIVFYQTDPSTGIRKRHRETWELNRIADKKEKAAAAKRAVAEVNRMLPHGYPYITQAEIDRRINSVSLADAIRRAMAAKESSDRYETRKDARSIGGVFLAWAKQHKLETMPAEQFTRKNAMEYMDYIGTRKTKDGKPISNTTWNNYRNKTGSLFVLLVEREIIKENPFSKVKRKAVAVKKRRKFTPEGRAAVAGWLHRHDYICLLAVTLQYYGLLRGTELRRLRKSDFDMNKGVIYLPAEKSKTSRDRWITLPETLLSLLKDERFASIPGNYLVFGYRGTPHADKECGRSYIWRHLRRCLNSLKKAGTLTDISGLSPYSFKDTGITDWLSFMSVPEVMKQAGHTNPGTTMIYYQPDPVNAAFRSAPSIFDVTPGADRGPIGHIEAAE